MRGAPAARPAVTERQKSGLGKYASSGTEGLKTMCGIRPSPHWASSSVSSSVCARRGETCRSPIAMNAESQDHWCGYRPCEGTVEVPVQLPSSTSMALRCSEPAEVVGSYTAVYSAGRAMSWAVRSTRGSPKNDDDMATVDQFGSGYRRVTSI